MVVTAATESKSTHTAEGRLRRMDPSRDLGIVADLIADAFGSGLDERGQAALREISQRAGLIEGKAALEAEVLQELEERLDEWLAQAQRPAPSRLGYKPERDSLTLPLLYRPEERDWADFYPGMRYVLLHTFSHALMRQLAMEAGYSSASIRERIYARNPGDPNGPMAGILIYTAAPDSEGTLGGLVKLGQSDELEWHISAALDAVALCASDPICAEHPPSTSGIALHVAACHACLFVPETSCERGNRYLDRSVLAPTFAHDDLTFFGNENSFQSY